MVGMKEKHDVSLSFSHTHKNSPLSLCLAATAPSGFCLRDVGFFLPHSFGKISEMSPSSPRSLPEIAGSQFQRLQFNSPDFSNS
jgi:hypothetical protein